MKKILITLLIALTIFGCRNSKEQKYENPKIQNTTNYTFSAEFNQENYIWENFIFSTNRVTKTVK